MKISMLLRKINSYIHNKSNTKGSGMPLFDGFYQGVTLDRNLEKNINTLSTIFKDCDDLALRSFKIAGKIRAELVFLDGMINTDVVDNHIIRPLLLNPHLGGMPIRDEEEAFQYAKESISTTNLRETNELEKVLSTILSGNTVMLLSGKDYALIMDAKGWEYRQVEQPSTETAVRGPKDAFTETISVNTMLIRIRIHDPRLKLKTFRLGRSSKTDLAIMYIEGIIDPKIVGEVIKRIDSIDVDNAAGNGFIEELIEDNSLSPFPQLKTTERPDVAVLSLFEGKLCIIMDHMPNVLVLPTTLNDLMHAAEDYYQRWLIVTMIRLTRFIGTFISLVLPSLYIAIISYHPDMIPTKLALSIASNRIGLPFPSFVEAFLMESTFELMREAGMRLPGTMGQTVGVLGAVVIGQSAVAANIVSPIMVVVIAVTGITNFTIPSFDVAISFRILRFGLMLLASVLGLYGVILGGLFILSHLCALKSFGVPYVSPWVPLTWRDLKDAIIRAPWFSMQHRQSYMHAQDEQRMNKDKNDENLRRRKESR